MNSTPNKCAAGRHEWQRGGRYGKPGWTCVRCAVVIAVQPIAARRSAVVKPWPYARAELAYWRAALERMTLAEKMRSEYVTHPHPERQVTA